MTKTLLLASAAVGATMLTMGGAEAASPIDWSGLYFGIHGGILNGDVNLSDDSAPGGGKIAGVIGGALAGYNFASPLGGLLWGLEVDAGAANVHGNGVACLSVCDSVPTFHYDLEWDAHFRVRAGMPVGNFMPFVAGGLAFADLNITENSLPLWNNVYTGGTIGGGFDAKLAPGVLVRAELLYDFYPTQTREDYTVGLTAFTVRMAAIFQLP